MVTKVLKIDVKDAEVEELEGKLKGVNTQINKVEGESKKADNALKKVGDNGGAISTLDAFTGGLATRIRDAAEASKVFNFNLKATRTALIATGVGAFVVALAAIVAYWDDIVDLITGANNSLESQVDLIDTKLSLLETEVSILDEQIRLGKERNTDIQVFLDKKKELIKLQLEELNFQKLTLEEQFAQEASEARRATFLETILGRKAQITADEQSSLSDIEKKILEAELKALKLQGILDNINNPTIRTSRSTKRTESREKVDKVDTIELPVTGISSLEELNALASEENRILAEAQAARTQNEIDEADARIRASIYEKEAKDDILQAQAGLLQQFSGFLSIIGEENKTFAIAGIVTEQIASAARIISSTGVANAKAVAASPLTGGQPWVAINSVSAGLGIATGAVAAAKAIGQLGGGGSVGGFNSPNGGGTAPAFNVIDNSRENQLNQSLLRRNDEPIEAFVVDKNVTSRQEARRNRSGSSSFG